MTMPFAYVSGVTTEWCEWIIRVLEPFLMTHAYDVFEEVAVALVVFAVTFYIVEAINNKLDNIVKHIYTMDKDKIIEKVYNDPLGFGSIKTR